MAVVLHRVETMWSSIYNTYEYKFVGDMEGSVRSSRVVKDEEGPQIEKRNERSALNSLRFGR